MVILKKSILTGNNNSMNLDITPKQLSLWRCGTSLIQDVMPNLSDVEREFLITGMSEEEQIKFYSQFEDEE